jgi:RNA polymerase sigma-70 factor (ECF subfamily)
MEYLDFRRAFRKIPANQREALILIGASGLSYEEAAEICQCGVGTLKSRVSRARRRLNELLEISSSDRPRCLHRDSMDSLQFSAQLNA